MKATRITPEAWASQYPAGRARTMDNGYSHASRISLSARDATKYDGLYIVTDMTKPRYDISRYEVVVLGTNNVPDGWREGVRLHSIDMTQDKWNLYTRTHVSGVTISDIDYCYAWDADDGASYLIAIEAKHNKRIMSMTQKLTYTHDLPQMTSRIVIPVCVHVMDYDYRRPDNPRYVISIIDTHGDEYTAYARDDDSLRDTLNSIAYTYEDAYDTYRRETANS